MHDWSDKYCHQILRHLRDAAAPYTTLVVVDMLMDYACVDEDLKSIPGSVVAPMPAPLLANGGCASANSYLQDIQILDLMNSKERTVRQFKELLEKTGWKLNRVVMDGGFGTPGKVIATPV